MKTVRKFAAASFLFAMVAFASQAQAPAGAPPAGGPPPQGRGPQGPGLTLTTTAFPDGGKIPDRFTMNDPKPTSPELDWTNVPAGTVTFTLILHDPDTALQKKSDDVLHWMVFNIPGSVHQLAEGYAGGAQAPDGTIQAKGMRMVGFMGPGAPAAGPDHHYTFELFALDTKLDLGTDATRQQVMDAMQGHIIGKAAMVGRFHKSPPPAQ